MRLTQFFFHTLKETPSDAEIESHKLMVRANFIKKVAPGIHTYMPLGLRSIRKFENIIREEMNRAGALELSMPMVQPRELWEETGRWTLMGKGLLKLKDRNDHDMCLGATHEEVVTDIVRREVKSYRDLPLNLYQIQTKFRDEIRPRFGLMRGKEFIMKDAYSFDVSRDAALKAYDVMFKAYRRIFTRCGLDFRTVKADAGAIGGSITHEFQVLASSGEDLIMACDKCEYASNIEVTPAIDDAAKVAPTPAGDMVEKLNQLGFQKIETVPVLFEKPTHKFPGAALEKLKQKNSSHKSVATPGLRTIEDLAKFLKKPAHDLAKTLFFKFGDKKYVCVMVRGDDELNEIKLKNVLGLDSPPEMCHEHEVLQITGAKPGSCGPVGISIPVICDNSLKTLNNWVTGANIDDVHLIDINPDKDFKVERWADVRKARENDVCPECGNGRLKGYRGIEVGHVFYLGDKYSKSMKSTFLDEKGEARYCEMGCYGIGVGRTVQAAIEQNHDKDGMIWPVALAPFQVMLSLLDVADPETKDVADKIYAGLCEKGVEVLYDDRDERPGSKFKDADLTGIPLRVNIGKRSLSDGQQVEMVERKTKAVTKVKATEAVQKVQAWISEQNVTVENRLMALK